MRSATLDTWRTSPTRLAEDVAAETDLVTVGYRDRLFTELAANAADAAAASGVPGRLVIWATDTTVHVGNTGAPLTVDGVRSLLALRVSAKTGSTQAPHVGRFGVGFTATATVADRVEVRSTTGSIVFDRAESVRAAVDSGVAVGAPGGVPPLLRLAWPVAETPAKGLDTEIILHLRDGVSVDALIDMARTQATDLLLELPALEQVSVADAVASIRREPLSETTATAIVDVETSGRTERRQWAESTGGATRWLVELGADGPRGPDPNVLCAPTPTDIELSLPARVITDLPLTPDRRHLHPDADIGTAAAGYSDLIAAVRASWRPVLIPTHAASRNRDDSALSDAVIDELRYAAWLPAATTDPAEGGSAAADLVPSRSVVFPDLTAALADVLAPVMGDLAHPDVSERRHLARLRSVGVTEIGPADLAERLIGVDRDPTWWRDLYEALSPLVISASDVEELGALPVPRADGRMNIGARGLFVADTIDTPIPWVPTLHADARHPLVERLGAESLSVSVALSDPALEQLITDVDDDEMSEIADAVFALLATDPSAVAPEWLSGLLIPDQDGSLRPADELLLPDSPLAAVLVDDSPFGVVADGLVRAVGPEVLRRIGVGWGFLTVVDELPVGPDHDLPDEDEWWSSAADPPDRLIAVRDLDLVADDRWPEALTLLATDEALAPVLADRDGYTAWWLRHHAVVDGHRLGWYRSPSDERVLGVRDALDHPHADALAAALGGLEIESPDDANTVLAHLGDPQRTITPGVAASAYGSVVRAVRDGVIMTSELDVPQHVRTMSGEAVETAVVVDTPWVLQVLAPGEAVLAGARVEGDDADLLADILDLPTAGEEIESEVRDVGDAGTAQCAEAMRFTAMRDVDTLHGEVRIHDELWVMVQRNGVRTEAPVEWWVDGRGVTHLRRWSSGHRSRP
ncbi:hypothetical protein EEB19_18170 [Gordonia sp. OPL2]|nr:hypothetical protein EEB19_18170 [Gordonia sp. OPL2]